MDMPLKIWFVESGHSERKLLGRSAEEYLLREFSAFDTEKVVSESECRFEEGRLDVVIPLDMPLVTVGDVERGAEYVKKHSLGVLALGGAASGAKIVRSEGGRSGYFISSPHFVKVDSAKNVRLVYNQLKERITDRLLEAGVFVLDPANTVVDDTVRIAAGAEILPFCKIEGDTVIEAGASVEGSHISDCRIEGGAKVVMSHLADTRVGAGSTVGPFARLRGAVVGKGCRVGDFVEIKNSVFGDGAKSAHLAYIGDADVGGGTNVGCGTVFCNYDGKRKHRTSVGRDCFIGANVNLVAPVSLGDGAFVAAGTTVTQDVEKDGFAIGRSRQVNKTRRAEGAEKDFGGGDKA